MKKKFYSAIFVLLLCLSFFSSCSSEKQSDYSYSQPKSYALIVQADNFAYGQLEVHYLKHKNEFGAITQEEYLDRARDLLNSVPSKDVLEKIRSDGDILRYRISAREFAVMTRSGRIKTYFKADYRYWLRQ